MGDHKEVRHERLYLKVPNTETLRKSAAGRHRRMLADGWRETERWQRADFIEVRFERSGHVPLKTRLPMGPLEQARQDRRPRGDGQFRGGGGGGRGRR